MIIKPIPGFLGYFAGDDGKIRKGKRVLKGYPQKKGGHLRVWVKKQHWTNAHCRFVHRLVAEAFQIPNPNPRMLKLVDHIDQNELNNRPSNLRRLNHQLNSLNNSALGCSFDKRKRKWNARVRVSGYLHGLGYYKTFLEAHRVSKTFRQAAFDRIYKELHDSPETRTNRFV